jgi:hypothetical protein
MSAKMPMRQGQQRQHNTSNNDSSTMPVMTPAQCGWNASATLANASNVPAGPLKANSVTMPAQRRQQGQLDAGNDASAMRARTPAQRQKNAIAALARPSKAKSLWADAGYSNEAMGDDDERDNDASLATCCDCVMIGWVPVCDAGGNAGVPREATPARRGQRRSCDKGNNAGAMLATTMARCWQWRQRVSRLRRDWADASLQCWQWRKGDKGNNASSTRAKAPTQRGQWRRHNAGNKDNSTMLAMTPAQCGRKASATLANASAAPAGPLKANSATKPAQRQQQGQLDAGNDASVMQGRTPAQRWKNAIAASARPLKAKFAVSRLQVQQQGHGRRRWAQQQCLTNNGSKLHHDWADASLWCWQQRGCAKGSNASATRAKMLARQGQRCGRNVGNNNGAMLAMKPARVATALWLGRCQFAMLAAMQRQWGQQCQRNEDKSAYAMRAMMPAQRRRQRQRNVGSDAGAMRPRTPAQRQQRHQRCICRTIWGKVTAEQRQVQRWGHGQGWWPQQWRHTHGCVATVSWLGRR